MNIKKLAGAVAATAITFSVGAATVAPASAVDNIKPFGDQERLTDWATGAPMIGYTVRDFSPSSDPVPHSDFVTTTNHKTLRGPRGGIILAREKWGKAIDKAEWKTVKCPPTPSNYERFIRAVRTGKGDNNNFDNAVKIQAYLHASFLSDRKNGPVAVKL